MADSSTSRPERLSGRPAWFQSRLIPQSSKTGRSSSRCEQRFCKMASWGDAPSCRLCVHNRMSKYYYLQRSAVVNKPSICARALKSREIRSDLVECDFVEVKVANGPWPAVRCFARLPVPPNLCLHAPTATLGRKAHFCDGHHIARARPALVSRCRPVPQRRCSPSVVPLN
jgi:hypothetical protein